MCHLYRRHSSDAPLPACMCLCVRTAHLIVVWCHALVVVPLHAAYIVVTYVAREGNCCWTRHISAIFAGRFSPDLGPCTAAGGRPASNVHAFDWRYTGRLTGDFQHLTSAHLISFSSLLSCWQQCSSCRARARACGRAYGRFVFVARAYAFSSAVILCGRAFLRQQAACARPHCFWLVGAHSAWWATLRFCLLCHAASFSVFCSYAAAACANIFFCFCTLLHATCCCARARAHTRGDFYTTQHAHLHATPPLIFLFGGRKNISRAWTCFLGGRTLALTFYGRHAVPCNCLRACGNISREAGGQNGRAFTLHIGGREQTMHAIPAAAAFCIHLGMP